MHARTSSTTAASTCDAYAALTPRCPQAHWFERELAEQLGVRPEGHPWLKPIRYHASHREGHDAWGRTSPPVVGVTVFFRVEVEVVHARVGRAREDSAIVQACMVQAVAEDLGVAVAKRGEDAQVRGIAAGEEQRARQPDESRESSLRLLVEARVSAHQG